MSCQIQYQKMLDEKTAEMYPWFKKATEYIEVIEKFGVPTIGVCFGGQLLANKYGAKMVGDKCLSEVGTFKVYLTDNAVNDELFCKLQKKFDAQFGHKHTAVNMPDNLLNLCHSDKVECEAFRVSGYDIWGLMFHPELNRERMRGRINLFPGYVQEGKTIDQTLEQFRDTPEATKVLHGFVSYIKNRV